MRRAIFAAVVLIALNASAGTISSLSPSSILTRSGEYFITANGSGFTGSDQFVIKGSIGTFTLNVSAIDGSTGAVTGWVPVQVVNSPDTYTLEVITNGVYSNAVTFSVYKPGRPPLKLHLPDILAALSKGRYGATIYYDATTSGGDGTTPTITCDPASGSTFPLGRSTINCTAYDSTYRDSASTGVTVVDGTPPSLTLPASYKMEGTQEGAYLKYEASAEDDVDGALRISCAPASGDFVPPGWAYVKCNATDASYNTRHGSFDVLVVPPDPGILTIKTPGDMKVAAQSKEGAIVFYEVSASSADPDPVVQCTPASGQDFRMGDTVVYCTAVDDFDQRAEAKFVVTVTDQTLLEMPDIAAEATSPEGTEVTYELKAEEWTEAIQCSPEPGSRFALGTTAVECSSTAADGRKATGKFNVTVADTIPPHIDRVNARVGTVDVAQGMVPVAVDVDAIDAADPMPRCSVADLAADVAGGFDWRVTADLELEVRTDTNRSFRLRVSCVDAAGNRSTASVPLTINATGSRRNTKLQ